MTSSADPLLGPSIAEILDSHASGSGSPTKTATQVAGAIEARGEAGTWISVVSRRRGCGDHLGVPGLRVSSGTVRPPQSPAAVGAAVGAAMSFIGLIHAPSVAWAASPQVALGYLFFGIVCVLYSFLPTAKTPVDIVDDDEPALTE